MYKQANLSFSVVAQSFGDDVTSIQFSTQDKNTAKLVFVIKEGKQPLDLTDVEGLVDLVMGDKSVFDDNKATVTAPLDGKLEYTITPEQIRHSGRAKGELQLVTKDGQSIGGFRFNFTIKPALVDEYSGPVKEFYIQDLEAVKQEVKKKADTTLSDIDNIKVQIEETAESIKDIDVVRIDTELKTKVSKVNGKAPDSSGNVTIPVPEVDTTNLATKTELNSVTTQLADTVKEINGVKPTNGKVTLPLPEIDTTNIATKEDLDGTHSRIDELIIESGDANAEVTDSHVSIVKNKTFTTLRNRLEEVEMDMSNVLSFNSENKWAAETKQKIDVAQPGSVTLTPIDDTSFNVYHTAVNSSFLYGVPVSQGKTYTLTFELSGPLGASDNLKIQQYDYHPAPEQMELTKGGNTQYSVTFTSTSEKMFLYLYLRNNSYNSSTNKLVFNNMKLYEEGTSDYYGLNKSVARNLNEENLSDEFLTKLNLSSNPCDYKGNEITVFNKGLFIGDSLTAGVFNTTDGSTTIGQYSYPTQLKKLTGIETVNKGSGGMTAQTWYTTNQTVTLSGFDFAVIQLGVNDVLQSVPNETTMQYLGLIIDKLKSENLGIKIFISTIIQAKSYSGTKYNALSTAIRTFVEGKENCFLTDMAKYGNTASEDAYNQGHLTALGYLRLAEDYKGYISYIITNNKSSFRNVQFIGTTKTY